MEVMVVIMADMVKVMVLDMVLDMAVMENTGKSLESDAIADEIFETSKDLNNQ